MTGEPTLRHGDHEKDGWVKYLQEQLAYRLNDNSIANDGIFGDNTLGAVHRFQDAHHLRSDGIVGDATWAALTGDTPAAEGTDGLAPHTHLDHGLHVVWTEHGGQDDGIYVESTDAVTWIASNVGDAVVTNNAYTASVTVGEKNYIEFIEIASVSGEDAQPGDLMLVSMTGVKASVGSGTHAYTVDMPSELGSAQRKGELTVP